ncbi:L-2-amino-thiazoline-4-carboxylic acid hydrolase [bacterium]|nr:L-2-amino-thiazoline-4-carboxylic acid hydrolase [bacterium]
MPLIKAFMKELGKEKTLQIAEGMIKGLARESDVLLAKLMGGNTIADFAKGLDLWTKDDALKIKVLEQTDRKYSFNVTNVDMPKYTRKQGCWNLETYCPVVVILK